MKSLLSETQNTNNQMEIDTQNIEREIIETREKQQSLHSEKGRDMQDSNQIYCFFGTMVRLWSLLGS